MNFSVEFGPNAERFLNKLPKDKALRIIKKLKQISNNPFRYLEHFEGEDLFKLSVGGFRVLVDINIERKMLFVRIFDKRNRVHKK